MNLVSDSNLSVLNNSWRTTAFSNNFNLFYAILSEKISTAQGSTRLSDTIMVRVYPYITSVNKNEINQLGQASVNCYPNPVSDELTVTLKNWDTKSIQISIIDYMGKEVYVCHGPTEVNKIDLFTVDSGMYLLKISDGKQVKFEKIAVQK